ncbi:transferrin [Contarinia nasturtii]|uniref:transferrin n=1 Tax=Contarinia nasturtii TaxID=265458 RepID=UPI0012D4AC04|nr:transferrin [Contarinia nasturtii]
MTQLIYTNFVILLITTSIFASTDPSASKDISTSSKSNDQSEYKMCVPHTLQNICEKLVSKRNSEYTAIKCVPARDRMECLEKVQKREADFLAVDPEDMYVALQMKNEDFTVFSEIRTVDEPDAEFRYEGIMLVHKNSTIKTLDDLRGRKSCHTGYGRNVGYKIPITKLRKHGIFKLSSNQYLPSVERELKGLSEVFTQSCLVGTWSSNEELNQLYKKRYSNLCALCEDPVKCNYPDRFSGYEGAIRCLVENGGDVAFTKVIYVRRFFGLPINNQNQNSQTEPQANPNDYEYLCEDGTRRAVTDKPCSWAARPWQGYMSNSDITSTSLSRLQDRIKEFYEEGKKSSDKMAASKLWINEKNVVVTKQELVLPGNHLSRAQYKDVIEREGPTEQKIRLCTNNDIEMRKCEVLQRAAYSRDIRPQFLCVHSSDCIQSVRSGESDAAIITIKNRQKARESQLIPIAHELSDIHYFVVVDKELSNELLATTPIKYDPNDERSRDAALNFNYKRGNGKCMGLTTDESMNMVRVIHFNQNISNVDIDSYELVCQGTRKAIVIDQVDANNCAYDATPPATVYTRNTLKSYEQDGIKHAFSALSRYFGRDGSLVDVFKLFGEFEPGHRNVLFSDSAKSLITDDSINLTESYFNYDGDEEVKYKQIQCRN